MNCWRAPERGGCLKMIDTGDESPTLNEHFAFSGLNWLTRFLNISVYFICYIKCDVLVWKSFNFSVSLSADCLWFLSLFAIGTVTHQSSLLIFLFTQWELMVEKWWKLWHPKTLIIKVRHISENVQCNRAHKSCVHALKWYLKLCSWPRRNLQTALDAKRAILKTHLLFFWGVGCFQIIVFFCM